jgi:hypothetical protein
MKTAPPLDELPYDLTLVGDKLLESLAIAHNQVEVQRELKAAESAPGFKGHPV